MPRHIGPAALAIATVVTGLAVSSPALATLPPTPAPHQSLRAELGTEGVLQRDQVTGTPRVVARLDGTLTGPSTQAPADIALDYVRAHLSAFDVDERDLGQLHLDRDYVDVDGTHHLVWQQRVRGVPAFDNGLRANVAADGRLVNVLGSPIHGLRASVVPRIPADTALRTALRDGGATKVSVPRVSARTAGPQRNVVWRSGDRAELVLYADGSPGGASLGWQVNARVSEEASYVSVVDASSGDVLWRANMVHGDQGNGTAWENYPGAPSGGTPEPVTFPVFDGSRLSGENGHVYADTQDYLYVPGPPPPDDAEFPATSGLDWSDATTTFDTTTTARHCSTAFPCTWDSTKKFSWRANLRHTAVQAYHYLNVFHDHLLADPIGFTPAAGNFQVHNPTGQGIGHDAVQTQIDDGADTAKTLCQQPGAGPTTGGFPNTFHATNANMAVQQDGVPPQMQMYLWASHPARCALKTNAPDSNSADDAGIVFHEYAHGLSGRLVLTSTGVPALKSFQAGSMGEAWSDWYAMDFLVTEGLETDLPGDGDFLVGRYPTGGLGARSEALDCPVGSVASGCAGSGTAGPGGYTYGDLTRIAADKKGTTFPEVHQDGEIWAQTLWQVRDRLGSAKSLSLVTRAMELSPPNPSFLDMRNAILLADQVAYDGADAATLWSVFAARGMGFFADTRGGNDFHPREDFSVPPACPDDCATLFGRVTDSVTGRAVPGARVTLPGTGLATTTTVSGHYFLHDVPVGTYRRLTVALRGHETAVEHDLAVAGETTRLDLPLARDWASREGGASVVDHNGTDFDSEFGCGPRRALDLSLTRGWMTDAVHQTPATGLVGGRKFFVLKMPRPVRVTSIGIAPYLACGGFDSSMAVKGFVVQGSATQDGPWRTLVTNTRALPLHGLTDLTVDRGPRVRFVRVELRSNRHQAGQHDDARMFMGLGEITVHGRGQP
ncbi:M36 family metallopeptidase [Nocardioides sp. CN2-186]|uniref:M36 family metallopeptidase n=1 Tax=Nocardioides tweenelious TaxID=3156607 RepID=UPI0032B4793E